MVKQKSIIWFRKDLRIADNPALHHALEKGEIIPIFIFEQNGAGDFKLGESSSWWLYQSLKSLSKNLDNKLQIFKGDSLKIIQKIIKDTQATSIYWNRCYEPWVIKRDTKIKKILVEQGIDVQSFNGSLLFEPYDVLKADGKPYKVFTAFFKAAIKSQTPRELITKPQKISLFSKKLGMTLEDLDLLDKDVDKKLSEYWEVSEKAAHKLLKKFIEKGLADYKEGRNFPAKEVTSRLSPYLHFGQISPNQAWYMVQDLGYDYASRENIQTFLKELGWREFAYNVLFFNPDMPRKNLDKKFDKVPWSYDKKLFTAWSKGQTGFPIIDAAMRELYYTGFMHNRMRMVVASFLIKNLMIHWHKGEDWFWNLLVDADIASNSFNWQWVAGSGYDAAPYFRIFNPILQAKKFDPQAEYIKQWVPEIKNLPKKYIFEPYKASEEILQQAGIELGKDYPNPIIDIQKSSRSALQILKKAFK